MKWGVGAVLPACFPRVLKRAKAAKQANNASSAPAPYSGTTKGVVGGKDEDKGEGEGEGLVRWLLCAVK